MSRIGWILGSRKFAGLRIESRESLCSVGGRAIGQAERSLVPRRMFFVQLSKLKNVEIIKRHPDNLQSDRQAGTCKAAGQANGRLPGEIEGARIRYQAPQLDRRVK